MLHGNGLETTDEFVGIDRPEPQIRKREKFLSRTLGSFVPKPEIIGDETGNTRIHEMRTGNPQGFPDGIRGNGTSWNPQKKPVLESMGLDEFFGRFEVRTFEFGYLKSEPFEVLDPAVLSSHFDNAQTSLGQVIPIRFGLGAKIKKIRGYLLTGNRIFHKKTTPVTGWWGKIHEWWVI